MSDVFVFVLILLVDVLVFLAGTILLLALLPDGVRRRRGTGGAFEENGGGGLGDVNGGRGRRWLVLPTSGFVLFNAEFGVITTVGAVGSFEMVAATIRGLLCLSTEVEHFFFLAYGLTIGMVGILIVDERAINVKSEMWVDTLRKMARNPISYVESTATCMVRNYGSSSH